jgi:type IV pilus assembly protein PilZ
MPPEKRQHPRRIVEAEVAIQVAGGPRTEARCHDLSLGGMFIDAQSALPYGTKLRIFMKLPDMTTEASFEATVRWSSPEGMGVQFGVMGAREAHGITILITRAGGSQG